MEEITVESLTEMAARKIVEMIKENNLQPGDKLPTEYELAEQMGISRNTLREAVRTLASRNILLIRQGAGTFISPKRGIVTDPLGLALMDDDASLALDMLDVRLMFEPEMAALAAAYAGKDDYLRIEEACVKVEKLIREKVDYKEADAEFHEAIATASGNRIIGKIIQVVHTSVQKNIFVTEDALREDTIIYHRQIADAVKSGDLIGARGAMIMHLQALRNFIVKKQQKNILQGSKIL